ncbi:MAG: hypothetical protein ABF990_11945 [Acetobacter sp.]|uniref:hypothetical protein n=1 Tax=Acetobacter sp. TaxID=440 RepID=UPI0039EBE146
MRDIKPTDERLAKGDVTESLIDDPVNGFSVARARSSGALYALRRTGTLTDAHVTAAERWARDYETGVLGGADPEASRQCGRADVEYALLSRIGAADRCRHVRGCLGVAAEILLIRLMIDGMSISAVSAHTGKSRERLAGAVEMVLEQLTEVYDKMPQGLMQDWSSVPRFC